MTPRETAEPLETEEEAEEPKEAAPEVRERDAATPELFEEYARTRDADLRERLILAHSTLARYLARKFANRGEPLEDLTQVGMIGLMNAIDRFDPTRGIRFATYATPTILGEIRRYFRDRGWAVKVPRRLQELSLAANKAVDTLTQELDRGKIRMTRAGPYPTTSGRWTKRWSGSSGARASPRCWGHCRRGSEASSSCDSFAASRRRKWPAA